MTENSNVENSPLPAPALSEWLRWLVRRRRRFVVRGNSMAPLLVDGDVVLVDDRAYASRSPQIGDVVVARHPYQRDLQIIKRVADLPGEKQAFLQSDNPTEGTDSRSFGAIPYDRIVGQVTARIEI